MKKSNQRFSFSFIEHCLFAAALLRLAISAHAQLGETNLEGLHLNVPYVFLIGDVKDPDCTVSLEIWGRKWSQDAEIGQVRIIRAVDERGTNLPQSRGWPLMTFKRVSHATKSMVVEGEIELLTPATPYPVFTNFMEHIGETLHHRLLKQCGIRVTLLREEGAPHASFRIRIEDPQKRFNGVKFQRPDGEDVTAITSKGSMSFGEDVKTFDYGYTKTTPKNANLKILVNGPMNSAAIPFKIKIRPPWISPEAFEAKVTRINEFKDKGTNTSCYLTWLSFSGGPLDSASGIKELHITRAESDTGRSFEIKPGEHWYLDRFARRGSLGSTASGTATMLIPLHIQPTEAAVIRILEGDADLFEPSISNHGVVEFTNIFAAPGEVIDNPILKENSIRIIYLGRANFRSKTDEWYNSQAWLRTSGRTYNGPTNVEDSLLFSIEDPKQRMIGGFWPDFLNQKGANLAPQTVAFSSNYFLFAFGAIPNIAKARVSVATPKSLQRVHFKVENVALP